MQQNIFLVLLGFLLWSDVYAQSDTSWFDISGLVELDEVTITAKRKGFNTDDFIDLVRKDQSFYIAFRNLRLSSYTFENNIKYYNRKQEEISTYYSNANQEFQDGCRSMKIIDESITGKYYKRKKKYKFYTSKLYERLFFTKGRVCDNQKNKVLSIEEKEKGMEGQVSELKKLIFLPGEKIDVPFFGNKTAIFSEKMAPYYNYKISTEKYQDQIACYVFTVEVKPEFKENKKGKTVIKFLKTYFDKSNFQVVAREYRLRHKHAVYHFNIKIDIELTKIDEKYIPTYINYEGFWNIPTKKREEAKFIAKFADVTF